MVRRTEAFLSYFPSLTNLIPQAGIRNAQDPIITGKAAWMFIPRAPIIAIHGAYRPTPTVIRAPKKKLTTTPITSLAPVNPVAVPEAPNGPTSNSLHPITTARIKRAEPKAIRICFTGSLDTIPAPM